ncbi:TetR/AcrR family transcriptional regulator [Acuticoccus sp. M5D2P5]|uniref:TetR/AcrR family transcriptional regulator n=1 Tax=Acuticoccus kalidii TaxID=2910977 RepID=UPI001F2ECAB2|nr:TetR/AcrR family transcriptional regulator [Acuticoccus kalidii]MCF3932026.1 TetR/AcrR family transcriptional regulator [Acuticoccus kalidii]
MQKARTSGEGAGATRGRGRPRAFDREVALDEAMRLFWRKGYEATSISDLTAAMGIGSPSLYAAFGSKDALYAEALRHYGEIYDAVVWGKFQSAPTAREAIRHYLLDSAVAFTGGLGDNPRGCMVTLASVGRDDHPELAELMRTSRAMTIERLTARLRPAVASGELPAGTDILALARFLQSVQGGMSILARDGASRAELESVAETALAAFDARTAAAAASD